MSNKVIKSIGFNITNADDCKILHLIDRKSFNFSGYVKKLILADLALREAQKAQDTETVKTQEAKPLTAAERLALLKSKNGINSHSDTVTND